MDDYKVTGTIREAAHRIILDSEVYHDILGVQMCRYCQGVDWPGNTGVKHMNDCPVAILTAALAKTVVPPNEYLVGATWYKDGAVRKERFIIYVEATDSYAARDEALRLLREHVGSNYDRDYDALSCDEPQVVFGVPLVAALQPVPVSLQRTFPRYNGTDD